MRDTFARARTRSAAKRATIGYLVDDITSTTINSDGIFQEHVCNTYPYSSILNKENITGDN